MYRLYNYLSYYLYINNVRVLYYYYYVFMYNVYLTKIILIISLKLDIIVQEKRNNITFKFIKKQITLIIFFIHFVFCLAV